MSDAKEKRSKPIIPVREPNKRTKKGIFDNLRHLPHPVEEFLGHVPVEPRVQETERKVEGSSDGESILEPKGLDSSALSKTTSSVKNTGPTEYKGLVESAGPVNSTGASIIAGPVKLTGPADSTSPAEITVKALQFTGPSKSEGPVEFREASTNQSPSDLADLSFANRPDFSLLNSLPETAGYELAFHQVTDYLFRQLGTAEQAIYRQLYRLTWGFGRASVLIGYPKLAERANVGESTARASTRGLEAKGLIKKRGMVFGLNHEQGIEWEVYPPPALVKHLKTQATKRRRGSKSEGPSDIESPSESEPMKDNVLFSKTHTQTQVSVGAGSRFSLEECRQYADHLKASGQGITNPGGYATKIFRSGEADALINTYLNPPAPLDINKCPACKGTNFVYVDSSDPDRGVKPCRHEELLK
jgi:hypothetical protein